MAVESWQLDAIPVADRDEVWRHVVSATHLPWTLDVPRDPEPVTRTWVRRRRLGDLSLIDCRAAPCAGRRQRRDLAGTDGEYIGVLLVSEGVEVLSQSGHELVMRPGDIVAWDSVRPARFAVLEPLRKQTLLVPRTRFQQMLPRPELVTARHVPSGAGTDLLRSYLRALSPPDPHPPAHWRPPAPHDPHPPAHWRPPAPHDPHPPARWRSPAPADLEPTAAFAAGNAALELLGAALGAVITPSHAAARDALRARITQHIEAQLGDREALRPRRIAADNAVSVRSLHALFQETGDTVGAYVRRRRLHHARAELSRPPWPTVTAVAHRWGFADAAGFSRAFRAQYGLAPSDEQRRARAA